MSGQIEDFTIIGGGLAGPTLAICLKRYNINSTIYEFREQGYSQPGHLAPAANASRILDRIGILDSISAHGFHYTSVPLLNKYRQSMTAVKPEAVKPDFERTSKHASIRVARSRIRDTLLKEAESQGIKVVYEKKLFNIEEGNGVVTLHFSDGEIVKSKFVVGADGTFSRVRAHLNPTQPVYTGEFCIYGVIRIEEVEKRLKNHTWSLPKGVSRIHGQEGSCAIMPTDFQGEEIGWFVNLRLPDRSREEWQKLDVNKEELRRLAAQQYCRHNWPEEVEVMIRNTPIETLRSWPIRQLPEELQSWTSSLGHIVVIGDAAHPISPAGGQGGAMALEDAETLAYALSKHADQALPEKLHKWEAHRMARVRRIQQYTAGATYMRTPTPSWLSQMIKEWFYYGMTWWRGLGMIRWVFLYDGESEIVRNEL